jgi:putative thioredoxin
MVDVTDATFEAQVVERSKQVPVVVDLWAEWCGPCKTLGPILETVIGETAGGVELAKVDVDANPAVAQAFKVQSIPAVYAMVDGQIVDGFMGAQPEAQVREFVGRLVPTAEESEIDRLIGKGDEASLRAAIELESDHPQAVTGLAGVLIERGDTDEGLGLLERIPESPETRRLAALARTGAPTDDVDSTLGDLLSRVKDDEDARQQFVDLLEVLGPDDPRTGEWRRKLSGALF